MEFDEFWMEDAVLRIHEAQVREDDIIILGQQRTFKHSTHR